MIMPARNLQTGIKLKTLLDGLVDAPDIIINGIATDSRELHEGYAFLACAGESSHGMDYSVQALEAGAAAIVYDSDTSDVTGMDTSVPLIAVPGLQQRIGLLANRWFNFPSEALAVTAITGTNGKTTVAMLFAQ